MTEGREELEQHLPETEAGLPPNLRSDWPVPRLAVYGTRDGVLAQLESWTVLGVMGALSRLPLPLRERVVGLLARSARRLDRRHSNAAREYIQQALGSGPAETEARVLQAWKHLLSVTLDSAAYARHVPSERRFEHFELELCADVQQLLAERRGCLMVGAHVGDWEVNGNILPWLGFDPFYVITRPPRNRPLSVRFQALREHRGVRILPRRGAMQHAPAIVRAGGALALLLDQRARTRPVMAPFFGRPARCDRSAGVLLKRLSVPIVFAACYRTERPWHWRVVIDRVLSPAECAGLSVEELVGRVNRELERQILRAPEQYFWLHDRYRGAEAGTVAAPVP